MMPTIVKRLPRRIHQGGGICAWQIGTAAAALMLFFATDSTHAAQPNNAELVALDAQDQADRKAENIDWPAVQDRDRKRSKSVRKILAKGGIHTANDYFCAAEILIHDSAAESMQLSYALSTIGIRLAPEMRKLREINASAWDRYLQFRNRPQWYGTQFEKVGDSDAQIYRFDRDVLTDAEREQAGGLTLAQIDEKLARLRAEDAKNTPASTPSAGTSAALPAPTNLIVLQIDNETLTALANTNPALALICYSVSKDGLAYSGTLPSEKRITSVDSHNTQEALEVLAGKRKIVTENSYAPRAIVEYTISKNDNNHLVVDIGVDEKVSPGPNMKFNFSKRYQIVAEAPVGNAPIQPVKFLSLKTIAN